MPEKVSRASNFIFSLSGSIMVISCLDFFSLFNLRCHLKAALWGNLICPGELEEAIVIVMLDGFRQSGFSRYIN